MKQVKAMDVNQMVEEVMEKQKKAVKEFRENGGICLLCKKEPGDVASALEPMHCKRCNEETEELLKKLRGPGFVEVKLTKK